MSWQHYLYSKLGTKRECTQKVSPDELVEKIIDMAKVLYGLHMVRFFLIFKCNTLYA